MRIPIDLLIALVAIAFSAETDAANEILYGPQKDLLREGKRAAALDALWNANDIGWGTPWYAQYFIFKVPVYRNHPFEPSDTDRKSIPKLIAQLRNDQIQRNGLIAWEKLVRIGQPAIPFLVPALNSDDHQQRMMASSILGRIGGGDAIDALIKQLPNDRRRYNALTAYLALLEIGKDALPALHKATESTDKQQSLYSKCLISVIELDPEAGAPWKPAEDARILDELDHHRFLSTVAEHVGRSEYQVAARYLKLKGEKPQ